MAEPAGGPRKGKKRRIGVRELVSIPEWGLAGVEAKIDTGAFTSSIDVSRVVIFSRGDGSPPQAEIIIDAGGEHRAVTVPIIGFRRVRNPSGQVTNRPIVEAKLSLAGKRFRTPVNLHRREGMRCRMIVGRRALAGRFIVDVSLRRRGRV